MAQADKTRELLGRDVLTNRNSPLDVRAGGL